MNNIVSKKTAEHHLFAKVPGVTRQMLPIRLHCAGFMKLCNI